MSYDQITYLLGAVWTAYGILVALLIYNMTESYKDRNGVYPWQRRKPRAAE